MAHPDGPRPPLADALDLSPHPEGGWFRQTWAAADSVTLADGRVRPTATLIYFLLPAGAASAWHRVRSDEVWLAHQGSVTLEYGGTGTQPVAERTAVVAVDAEAQALVPHGVWQRTRPREADALVSCLVSPGFDFADFELAQPPSWVSRLASSHLDRRSGPATPRPPIGPPRTSTADRWLRCEGRLTA